MSGVGLVELARAVWPRPDRAIISMLFELCQGWKDALTKLKKHEGR